MIADVFRVLTTDDNIIIIKISVQASQSNYPRSTMIGLSYFTCRMVVDHKRRVAYCYVPKNSCTTWKAIMANNTGVRSDVPFETLTEKGFIHRMLGEFGLSKETYTDKLQTYTKFIVVRHPFDRLLSAYRDKAFPNLLNGKIHGYYYKIKKSVLRRSRHILTAQERQSYVPTFEEFAQHVLLTSNIHWNSYAFRCDPCHINYDYIIRLETLSTDNCFLATFTQKSVHFRHQMHIDLRSRTRERTTNQKRSRSSLS